MKSHQENPIRWCYFINFSLDFFEKVKDEPARAGKKSATTRALSPFLYFLTTESHNLVIIDL